MGSVAKSWPIDPWPGEPKTCSGKPNWMPDEYTGRIKLGILQYKPGYSELQCGFKKHKKNDCF
jgi:hypothetical protein